MARGTRWPPMVTPPACPRAGAGSHRRCSSCSCTLVPLSQLRWIHLATDGTPFALLTNSMYQPGGAMLWLLVTFRLTLVPLPEIDSATYRWFGSDWWVTAAGRMSSAETIFWFVL